MVVPAASPGGESRARGRAGCRGVSARHGHPAADRAAIAPGEGFRLLLHQRLAPGWHTYWINPGDAGAPPELRLDLPEGWQAGPLRFPTPRRIPYGPLLNFGYTGEAGFLMELTPPPGLRPGDTVTLEAEASWLVCAELCIPRRAGSP
jgi:thiol:disulfide interchange protein DsbD